MTRLMGAALAAMVALAGGMPPAMAQNVAVGVLKLASSGPVFIAEDKGYFKDEGLDAELKFFTAAQPIAVAAVSGDVDIGVTGLTAGFYNLAGKGALKIVAAQSREEHGYHLIAYLASNQAFEHGLDGLGKLPGHSVGITQVGSTFHYSLGLLAEKRKFPLASVKLVPLQSIPNMVSALKGGQVDAALIPATAALPMVNRGDARLLGWVGDETPWQLGGIFATPKTIVERRPVVEKFLRAYRKAAHEFHAAFLTKDAAGKRVEGPEAPALVAVIAKYTGQSEKAIRTGIPFIDPEGRLLVRDVYNQVAWYQGQNLVDKSVDPKSVVDLSFVAGHRDAPK
jgi:NitT/TauT family transport system substrate-binding protein